MHSFYCRGTPLSASFVSALSAARETAGSQHYPQGALYVVATPIGNLADITLRALHVLQLVDAIACEDTRHTQSLLRSYGLDRGAAQLIAVHQHNEAQAAQIVLERLTRGERIAYVSDAGTPCISDPGARLVATVQASRMRCIPLPGASSVTCAMSVAGAVSTESRTNGFVFAGFLPAKGAERTAALQELAAQPRSAAILEAPHRIGALAADLAALGERPVTLARELTKQFEEIHTCRADALATWLASAPQHSRGEFIVVLHPAEEAAAPASGEGERVLRLLLAEVPLKTAVRIAAEITREPRNTLYQQALALKQAAS